MYNNNIIIENAYLYSMWSGRLKAYEGSVYVYHGAATRPASFVIKNEKRFMCSDKPGEVCNAVVWLAEKDDKLARKILIEYEEKQIAALMEKVENHQSKIFILKEGL